LAEWRRVSTAAICGATPRGELLLRRTRGASLLLLLLSGRRMESQEEEDDESMDPVFNLRGFFIRM
jgi:hypothetical protein